MECESMSFVKNHIPYLWDLSNSFSNNLIDVYSCEGFHQVIYPEEWSIKLRSKNGGWHESLNLLHVSRCEMLHFVTSCMKQNKSRKQTLGSVQYGLEISFKRPSHGKPKLANSCWQSQVGVCERHKNSRQTSFYLTPTVCKLVCRLFLCRSHTPTWVCQHEFANLSLPCEGRFRAL